MTTTILAALSIATQSVFFVGFGFFIFDLFSLTYIITPEMEQDPSLLHPYIRETVNSYRFAFGIGILGSIATYLIYLKSNFREQWFLRCTRVLAWLWLPFIPIGTIIGIVLLGARKDAVESQAAN